MTSPDTFIEGTEAQQRRFNEITSEIPVIDPFQDDTPIVAVCDLENPESCETCQ